MPVSPIETILQASERTAAEVEHQNGARFNNNTAVICSNTAAICATDPALVKVAVVMFSFISASLATDEFFLQSKTADARVVEGRWKTLDLVVEETI